MEDGWLLSRRGPLRAPDLQGQRAAGRRRRARGRRNRPPGGQLADRIAGPTSRPRTATAKCVCTSMAGWPLRPRRRAPSSCPTATCSSV
ncbi:MAG: hypothetical protein MZW92_75885 [Comamonadaceae bacterium]|nr:hypothetical protein [Comamonadaceae bacterium]